MRKTRTYWTVETPEQITIHTRSHHDSLREAKAAAKHNGGEVLGKTVVRYIDVKCNCIEAHEPGCRAVL